jgi:hypothetical protein
MRRDEAPILPQSIQTPRFDIDINVVRIRAVIDLVLGL